ncbi:uncharacterized protein LOC134282804 [Saccostrea cucullata]|uniref:uncharacterized protein LOC134282804 n=1 Tax=Saccostrea cuccullata TaxID=36930 RepID=UPI002ED6A11B
MPRGRKRVQVAPQDQNGSNTKRARSSKRAAPPNAPNPCVPEQHSSVPSQHVNVPSADEIAEALLKKIQNPTVNVINEPVSSTQSVSAPSTTPGIDHPNLQTVTSQPPSVTPMPQDLLSLIGNLSSRSTISQPVPSATSDNNLPSVSSVEGSTTIPVNFSNISLVKNALPLAYHVSDKLKNSVFDDVYVDFAALLPHVKRPDEVHDISSGVKLLTNCHSTPIKTLFNVHQWNNAFDIYMSLYITKYPSLALDLIKYGNNIRKLALDFGFQAARFYDEEFRKLRQVHKLEWSVMHDELWRVATSQNKSGLYNLFSNSKRGKTPFLGRIQQRPEYPKGFCWRFCATGQCGFKECKLKHLCVHCGKKHASDTCTSAKKSQISPKSQNTSEV